LPPLEFRRFPSRFADQHTWASFSHVSTVDQHITTIAGNALVARWHQAGWPHACEHAALADIGDN